MIIRSTLPFLFCLLTVAFAKDYRFEHLTNEDGLSENSVLSIYQDSRGFLWFGTIGGLNRYDGYTFTVFQNDPKDSLSIGGNYVVIIKEDNDGNLWVGTYQGGLNRFVRETESFLRYGTDEGQIKGLADNSAISLLHDSKGRFWVGTVKGGLNLLDRETGAAISFKMDPENSSSISGNIANCIAEDRSGNIWIGNSHHYPSGNVHGLNRLDTLTHFSADSATAKFTRFLHEPNNDQSLSNSSLSAILTDPLDNRFLWIATRHSGIAKFNIETGKFIRFQHNPLDDSSISSNKIYNMFFDSKNRLWLGSFGGGLNRWDRENKRFVSYRHDKDTPTSISDDKVISIEQDNTGNLWLGTHKAGINKLNFSANQFKHYGSHPGDKIRLSSSFISALHEDENGDLWIGTQKGLNKLNKTTSIVQSWEHNSSDPTSLSNNWVYALEEDSKGNFWVGTYGGGLNLMNRETGNFRKFQHDKNDLNTIRDNDVLALESDGDYLWIGTRGGGLSRMNLNTWQLNHFTRDSEATSKISNNIVRDILIDSEGILWLATSGGLNRFDPEEEEFTHFIHDPQDEKSITNDLVISLLELDSDIFLVGTINGLDYFDKKQRVFSRMGGLPNEVIHTILKDQSGHVWVSTNGGVSHLNESEKFVNYTVDDGLSTNEFNQNVALLGSTGEVYFGGPKGLVSFFPDSLQDNNTLPQVVLTDFLLFNKSVEISTSENLTPLKKSISETDNITLSWEENVFSFEFAGLDYTRPEKNDYAYMMEGFDENWIPAGARRFATYTNLDPGTYTFRVKASNNRALWNEKGMAISLTINPPFWKTWWFRLLVLLGIILIPLLIYRNRVLNLLALERLRVRIASDLHDDIGGTLNAIVMQTEILKSGVAEKQIPEKLDKISDMGRDATRMLSDVVWSIDARNDSFGDLIDHIKDFADLTLGKKDIQVEYQISGIDLQKPLDINIRQNLYLISKEALSNIAKYADATQVYFDMLNENNSFTLRIRDNGRGRKDSTRRSGHGLRNMDLRAERLKGKISFNDSDGFTVLFIGPAF